MLALWYAGYALRYMGPEIAAIKWYGHYIEPEDVVVEAGASRGYSTVGALYNLCRFTYAFEPNPTNFKYLSPVTEGISSIKTFDLGLGDQTSKKGMRDMRDGSTFILKDAGNETDIV
jgi:hypothetical protein